MNRSRRRVAGAAAARRRTAESELPDDLTTLLNAWSDGDAEAGRLAVEAVYARVHRMAARQLAGERAGSTLQATAVVHEVYLRLAGLREIEWEGRGHFFGSVSETIRRVLVDHARFLGANKREGRRRAVQLDDAGALRIEEPEELLALHDALDDLACEDPELAAIVVHRFFGGFEYAEIADLIGRSVPTIKRRFRVARAWLYEYLAK